MCNTRLPSDLDLLLAYTKVRHLHDVALGAAAGAATYATLRHALASDGAAAPFHAKGLWLWPPDGREALAPAASEAPALPADGPVLTAMHLYIM